MTTKKAVEQIEKAAKKPLQDLSVQFHQEDFLSTGSTLLDLACTESHHGGLVAGKFFYFVGDSSSGKTFLSMTCFAEAMRNRGFKNHRIIYDNVEDGCNMNLVKLFGQKVADKIEWPNKTEDGEPIFSETIEEFYDHLDDAIQLKKPFIYVLDSMDGLSSEYEEQKFQAHKRVRRGQGTKQEAAGSYGDGKAKKNSEGLRQILAGLRDTGSILIIISQTRDNLGFGFEKKTRSGGRALRFYATLEVWFSVVGKINKTVKGQNRQTGITVEFQVKKNRLTGKNREGEIEIYPDYGIDDLGTCVNFLLESKWWKQEKQSIVAEEFGITCTKEKLIQKIEAEGMETELKKIVEKCWKKIEAELELKRKPRY